MSFVPAEELPDDDQYLSSQMGKGIVLTDSSQNPPLNRRKLRQYF